MKVASVLVATAVVTSFNFAFANPNPHPVQEEPKASTTEEKLIEVKPPNFLPPMERVNDTVDPQFRSNLIRGM